MKDQQKIAGPFFDLRILTLTYNSFSSKLTIFSFFSHMYFSDSQSDSNSNNRPSVEKTNADEHQNFSENDQNEDEELNCQNGLI